MSVKNLSKYPAVAFVRTADSPFAMAQQRGFVIEF